MLISNINTNDDDKRRESLREDYLLGLSTLTHCVMDLIEVIESVPASRRSIMLAYQIEWLNEETIEQGVD